MTTFSEDAIPTPPGEGARRALLCLVTFGAVAVAVVFSPAASRWHAPSAEVLLAALQP